MVGDGAGGYGAAANERRREGNDEPCLFLPSKRSPPVEQSRVRAAAGAKRLAQVMRLKQKTIEALKRVVWGVDDSEV